MLENLINRILGNAVNPASSSASALPHGNRDDGSPFVTVNTDNMSQAERDAIWAEASGHGEIPIFDGHIEHGYAADDVADPDCCPRCGGMTKLEYANFIYLTQLALRVMLAPLGYFCTKCPTVIVETALIESGMKDKRYQFRGVLGIDYGKKKEPDYFRTWSGEDLVYLLDEDGNLEGVTTYGRMERHTPTTAADPAKKNANKKKREKMAKLSRRENRKK